MSHDPLGGLPSWKNSDAGAASAKEVNSNP
jgi:hypothetical protein